MPTRRSRGLRYAFPHPELALTPARLATPRADEPDGLRLWRLWPFALGLAGIIALFSALVLYWGLRIAGRPITVPQALTGLADWIIWAVLAPLAAWFGVRFPLGRGRRLLGVIPHLMTGTALALGELAVFTVYNGWYNRVVLGTPTVPFGANYATIVAQWFPVALLVYWLIVTAVSVYESQRRYRAKQVSEARLQTELARAQLDALRAQLHPHFLFNALNTVAVLVREGRSDHAVETVSNLGSLLRRTLEWTAESRLPLRDEIAFVRDYLDIERQRYGDRIHVEYEIDARSETVPVPALILQPIVENAVRHGVARARDGGRIVIAATVRDRVLEITVRDSGPGFSAEDRRAGSRGVGLGNTAARLERLYGVNHLLETRNTSDGAEVLVRLPLDGD